MNFQLSDEEARLAKNALIARYNSLSLDSKQSPWPRAAEDAINAEKNATFALYQRLVKESAALPSKT